MNRHLLFAAIASLSLAATGCQHSGTAESNIDVGRPRMAESTYSTPSYSTGSYNTGTYSAQPAGSIQYDTSTFTVPYTATSDTSWMRTSTDTTGAGTLRAGDTVYLRSDAPTSGIIPVRTTDNRIVYVRASDLRVK